MSNSVIFALNLATFIFVVGVVAQTVATAVA